MVEEKRKKKRKRRAGEKTTAMEGAKDLRETTFVVISPKTNLLHNVA